jgi:endothelin-converting enzyme/putative endopeptidase
LKRPAIFIFLIALSLAAWGQSASPQSAYGVAVNDLDRAVKPGDDFYRFANGNWLKRTEIPPDRSGVNVFSALADEADQRTAALVEEAGKSDAPAGSDLHKIAGLYQSFMNEDAIEKRGLEPLRSRLRAVRAIRNKRELARTLGETLRADVDPLNGTNFHTSNLFGLWTAPGFADPEHYHAYLLQGGLTLPDREYYLAKSEHMQTIRAEYETHVARMMEMAGFDKAKERAARIVALEHAIAEKHVSLADSEDIHKANNIWTHADFRAKAPGLDWSAYFQAAGLDKTARFNVWQPSAFVGESALVASQPLNTWKDWLAFHYVEQYASYLPSRFADERFAFFGKTLMGTPQQRPRWQRGIFLVNDFLGDAVGQLYAQRYFPPAAKAQAQAMVSNIIAAFRQRIDALAWMAPATRKEAKAKLDTLYVGIGYPEVWEDYSGYEVRADDLFGNVWRARLFEYQRSRGRLGKVVERREWAMTPQTVNAVNLPLQNALNFPAAILQPPFFDAHAPAAFNYGAIGTVIGHEISHTFDNEGSTFDSTGRLRDWWTPADAAHFEEVTAQLARQFDTYQPFPDLAVNGRQTLSENIADLGGLAAAYDGFRMSLSGKPAPSAEGFSADQQFFLAYAQNWATKQRPAALRQQVMTDPHAPAEYRANTVRNLDGWYAAFPVQPGETLYLPPAERVRIW